MRNNYQDLKKGLAEISELVHKENKYFGDPELHEANQKVMRMCKQKTPVYGFVKPDDICPTNVTNRAMFRVALLMRRNGINWKIIEWDKVIEWLKENWDKVLRVLLSILVMIIL